ncbi:hypothetical protein, partial [Amaricoccus sp.]|uniref:hypothetical protein n=1 Tax=Amaricoccus sp. TaxID=1872485 RepID=UPI002CB398C4
MFKWFAERQPFRRASLGRHLQRRTDRTNRDAVRSFPDDLMALLISQSATVPHVKYTFLFLANFVQARLL